VIPLSDGIAARRFPIVNAALIAANYGLRSDVEDEIVVDY
jgi:hypothetical protein